MAAYIIEYHASPTSLERHVRTADRTSNHCWNLTAECYVSQVVLAVVRTLVHALSEWCFIKTVPGQSYGKFLTTWKVLLCLQTSPDLSPTGTRVKQQWNTTVGAPIDIIIKKFCFAVDATGKGLAQLTINCLINIIFHRSVFCLSGPH